MYIKLIFTKKMFIYYILTVVFYLSFLIFLDKEPK